MTTLGVVRLENGAGATATLRTRAALALLADLALHPDRDAPREALADRHWPEDDEETGRAKLRLALHSTRRELGPVLTADRASVRLCEGCVSLDAREFARTLDRAARAEGDRRVALLDAALALAPGPFLPGHWDDWSLSQRERLDALRAGALLNLARARLEAGDPEGAIPPARTLLDLEPYDAAAHRVLLNALARLGRAGALARHLDAARAIYAEVGSPLPAELESHTPKIALPERASAGEEPFVGREIELAALRAHLETPGLITLWGPPGIGKTRLARELLAGDDARFVPAAALATPEDLLAALRARFAPGGEGGAGELAPALSDAPLVLDDFQALAPNGGRETVAALLGANPALRLILTSQLRLGLPGERVISLEPLASPEPGASAARAALFPAVQLLVARARGPLASREGLGDLGRALGGNPLAIEVAADWLRALTPAEVLARLARSSGGLSKRGEGGRTLAGAIAASLALLTPAARDFLSALAVCEGGWDLPAAAAVGACEDPAPLLADLVDRSLVALVPWRGAARYELLEAVRDEVRAGVADAHAEVARDRHAAHFALRAERDAVPLRDLFGPDPRDDANLDLALARALDRWTAERAAAFVQNFAVGTLHRGRDAAVRNWIEAALARLPEAPSLLRAKLVNGLGTLAFSAGELDEAERRFRECGAMHEAEGNDFALLVVENNLASVLRRRGDFAEALAGMRRVVRRLREDYPERDRLYPEMNLAEYRILAGDEGGVALLRELLPQAVAQERPILTGHLLVILARAERGAGRPGEAVAGLRRAMELYERHEGRTHLVEAGAVLVGALAESGEREPARAELARAAERLLAAPSWSGGMALAEAAAGLAATEGAPEAAAGFHAAAETAATRARQRAEPPVQARLDALAARLSRELPPDTLHRMRLLAETESRADLARALRDYATHQPKA